MPFGIPSIEEIRERANPFDDEPKRKKKRPKPPKPSRAYDVPIQTQAQADLANKLGKANRARNRKRERERVPEPPGFMEILGKARKEARGYPGVIAQLSGEVGGAAYKDIRRALPGKDPFPYAMERNPKTGKLRVARDSKGKPIESGGHLFEALAGIADVAGTEGAKWVKDVGLVVAGDDLTVKAVKQFDKDLAKRIERASKQAESRLAEAPIGTLTGLVGGAAIVSRGVTVPALATRMQKATPGLSRSAAILAAKAETKNPGVAKTVGIKGGIPPRYITTAEGEMVAGRPWSRTPGGRAGQTIYDEITTAIDKVAPNAPFSASKRVGAVERRRRAQIDRGALAAMTPHIQQLGDILEGTTSRKNVRGKVRQALGVHRPIRERAEALIAALEGPQGASIRQSVEARIASLEDTLKKSAELEPQYNRTKVLRAKLKRAVDEDDRKAIATELRELTDELDLALGRRVAQVTGSPERRRAVKEFQKRFGRRKTNALIVAYDAAARTARPDDPKAWYRENLAEVTSEKAEAFLARIEPLAAQYQTTHGKRQGLTAPRYHSLTPDEGVLLLRETGGVIGIKTKGKNALFSSRGKGEGAVFYGHGTFHELLDPETQKKIAKTTEGGEGAVGEDLLRVYLENADVIFHGGKTPQMLSQMLDQLAFPEEVPVFYSELQHQVDRIFTGKTQRMVSQSLRKKIRENVSDVEWKALGMDAFFDQFPPTYRVSQKQVQDYLKAPLNAYNLDEVVYSSLVGRQLPGSAQYAEDFGNALVYKTPTPAEPYYELVMSLNESPRKWLEETKDDRGTAFIGDHWDVDNPIVHVRFHIVTDNSGKRAIVIDEIQSDWHSEVRKRMDQVTPGTRQATEAADPAQLAATMEELRAKKQEAYDNEPRLKELDELVDKEQDYIRAVTAAEHAAEDWPGGDPAEIEALEKAIADAHDAEEAHMNAVDDLEAEIGEQTLSYIDQIESDMGQVLYRQSQAQGVQTAERFEEGWPLGDTEIDAAVRRMMRWAHDSDIDRIIIVPGEVQTLRNLALPETPSGKSLPDPSLGGDDYAEFTRLWKEFEGMDADAMRAFARRFKDSEESKAFFKMYEERYPNEFEKAIGHKGRFIDGIISGRYTDALNTFTSDDINLRAWVIDLGEEGRRRAAIPMRQMQQMPDWDELPRGATELLADGRTALRLFEGADVDTVIHELAHIALPDIDDVARSTLEKHFGGPIDDWTTGQNEAYARAFEQYMRTGRAANVHLASAFSQIAKWMRQVWNQLYHGRTEEFDLDPQVAAAFDRMLGYKGVPTVLNKTERAQVNTQIKELTKALDLPLDSPEYAHAMDTLESLSEMIEAAGEQILTRHASPALAESIKEGLARRRDIMTTRMAEQDVLPEGMEWTPEMRARGYFPQTSIWDIQGMPQTGPVRMQAVQDVVGTPRIDPKAVMRRPNRLIRYSTGEVLNDPAVLVRILRSRMRYLNTLEARNQLWARGKPIKRGEKIPRGTALIRNPERTPKKIADDIYAALRLSPERYSELEMRGKMDEIDESDALEEAAKDFIWMPSMGTKPNWVSSDPSVRAVPLQVARTRLGDVFTSGARNTVTASFGTANALARLAAIYLPFAGTRYVTRNAAQNAVMLAMTQPTALARIGRAHSKYKADHPEDYHRILAEGGTILGTALPEFNTRPKGTVQGVEQKITERTGAAGSFLGKFADNPFRWASWTKHAESYGFHGPERWHRLLTDKEFQDVRETVMQRTRDDMIDFDSLTPWEKEVVSRYMFLWPFIRGITKWPFMYARDYPLRVAGIAALNQGIEQEEDSLGTGAIRERLMRGGRDFGWLDPTGPAQENIERFVRIKEGRTEVKLSAIADMLAPHLREVIQSLSDRQGVTWKKSLANTYVPFASTVNALSRGGSTIDQIDRFLGQSTEPPISIVKQREKRSAEINHYLDEMESRGFAMNDETYGQLATAHEAYERYKELSARMQFGLRDQGKDPSVGKDSKNHRKRAAMLITIAEEFYPDSMDFSLEDYDDLTEEGRDLFYREVEKGLWGVRQDFLTEAKEEFGKYEAA